MSADLNLTVGAVISDLVKKLDDAEARIKSYSRQAQTALKGVDTGGFQPMIKGSNQASTALLNLGRVAQDAPFGIIGIANNINPLLESFQRLQKETGDTAVSFKALAGSLLGGGGLGLAVSVVTGLLSYFAMKAGSGKKAVSEYKNEILETERRHEQFAQSIEGSSGVMMTHNQMVEAGKKKMEDYSRAIDTAGSAIMSQAKDLKDLRLAIIDTSGEYDNLAESTIRSGTAQFLFAQKSDAVKKLLEANIKKQVQDIKNNNPFAAAGILEFSPALISKNKIEKDIAVAAGELKNSNTLSKGFDDLFAKLLDGSGKKPTKVRLENIELILPDINPFTSDFWIKTTAESIRNAKKEADQRLKDIRLIFPAEIKPILDIKNSPLRESKYKLTPEEIIDIEQWSKTIGEIKTDLVGELINGLTSAITNGGGGLRDTFKSLLTLVGDFLIQLGKGAVKAALVAQALKLLQKNPITGLIAGLSAIALGSLIKNTIPKFATGVQNFRGGTALVGERGPELLTLPKGSNITPNDKLGGAGGGIAVSIYGEFRQRGTDMVAVIATTQRSNARRF